METAVESEVRKLFDLTKGDNNILTIGTTVDTGLEWQAVDECRQKLGSGTRVVKERGKIYFNVSLDDFHKVQEMRSIDNVFIIGDVRKFSFNPDERESDILLIKNAVNDEMKLEKYLSAWKVTTRFPGKIYPSIDEWNEAVESYQVAREAAKNEENEESRKGRKRGCDPSLAEDHSVLSFRVTCERTGKHSFESSQVATAVGGELQDKYHWIVDLTLYHLEIVCKVTKDEMVLNLRVTHESKHRRNIAHFGPTTLRATVCYNLLRLAQPRDGDVIIDPMCGGGSIPIEIKPIKGFKVLRSEIIHKNAHSGSSVGIFLRPVQQIYTLTSVQQEFVYEKLTKHYATLAFPKTYVLCGDNHEKAVERTRLNLEALPKNHKTDLLKWSVANLPFRDSYIDVFVTDMPFGKRSGTMSDNRVLYKKYLIELARVVKLKYGRLVLLTYDRRSISVALQASKDLFRVTKMVGVNMGGLNAAVYVLKRTNLTYDQFSTKPEKSSGKEEVENADDGSTIEK